MAVIGQGSLLQKDGIKFYTPVVSHNGLTLGLLRQFIYATIA